METSPTTTTGIVPAGGGTDYKLPLVDLTQAMKLDLDNPHLKRVLANLDDPDGVISAFQSFTS